MTTVMTNMTTYLVIDIETIPYQNLSEDLKPECKLGNLKDKNKIEAKQKEWQEGGQIKALSLDPLTNEIVCISMWSSISNNFIEDNNTSEKDYLQSFWNEVKCHDLIVGKNHISFDIPTIIIRSMFLNIPITRKFSLSKYQTFSLFDIQQVLTMNFNQPKSLNWLAKRFGIQCDESNGSKVYDWWKEGKKDMIVKHCQSDVLITKEIFERIKDYFG
ncbi:MAG: ribonuclease H-like domain-containing protein [Candidatus Nanoarchaeia archaeon]